MNDDLPESEPPDWTCRMLRPGDEIAWDPRVNEIRINGVGYAAPRAIQVENVRDSVQYIIDSLQLPLLAVLRREGADYVFRLE
jgi:hypothetical protein